MNDLSINTKENKNCCANINNNHVTAFTSYSSNLNVTYNSHTTSCNHKNNNFATKKNRPNYYTICIDWFQFVCKSKNHNSMLESFSLNGIKIKKYIRHDNDNFRFKYTVSMNDHELCDIYAVRKNLNYKKDEVSIKIKNARFYSSTWTSEIQELLKILNFEFVRLSKVDIALDGHDLFLKINLFKKFGKSKTIQINNANLKIREDYIKKTDSAIGTYYIGSENYQKTACIYGKSDEILKSGKTYISDYWHRNGLNINEKIGRFELQLGSSHLSKYKFDSLDQFSDPKFLGRLLHDEVTVWLRFYKVKLKDIKAYRKDIAIQKGKEIPLIHWRKLPKELKPIEKIITNPDHTISAKRNISFSLNELEFITSNDSVITAMEYVVDVTNRYNLYEYTMSKINFLIADNPKLEQQFSDVIGVLSEKSKQFNGIINLPMVNLYAGIIEINNTDLG